MSIIKNDQLDRNQISVEINRKVKEAKLDVLPANAPTAFENAPDSNQNAVVLAGNEIDNSDFAYSKDAYLNAVQVGGDVAFEAFNWYRQRFIRVDDVTATSGSPTITSALAQFKAAYAYPMNFVLLSGKADGTALIGTLTRVSDNTATLSANSEANITNAVLWFGEPIAESTGNALKSSGHALFAASEAANVIIPRWNTAEGCVEIGSSNSDTFDIACPLPSNLAKSGLRFYASAILAKRTGTAQVTTPLRFCAGIWDETPTQRRFLEAGNLSLDVVTVGTPGAKTYRYKVIAETDAGLFIDSEIITITTGNFNLSTSNYNRLQWSNVRGILDFTIERETGGVFKKIFTIQNGSTSYNDYGGYDEGTIAGFANIGASRALSYAERVFTLQDDNVWFAVGVRLQIAPTYNSSLTTGRQWLRISIAGVATAERQVLLDRVLFSLSDGGWDISSRDRALQQSSVPTVNPESSNQGSVGIISCLTSEMPVVVSSKDGKAKSKEKIKTLEQGAYFDDGERGVTRLSRLKMSAAKMYWEVYLSNKIRIDCTDTERFVTSRADTHGTMLKNLAVGDDVLTKFFYFDFDDEGDLHLQRVERATILQIEPRYMPVEVFTPSLKDAKTFVAGVDLDTMREANGIICGAILHNLKEDGRDDLSRNRYVAY